MLVTTIDNSYQLEQLFRECGRENHFSIEGFDALYDYLYDYSEDVGEDFKVDVIALCCAFTEYESWEKLYNAYSYPYNKKAETWEDTDQEVFKEWIQDKTTVIEATNYKDDVVGIIIQCF